MHITHDAPTGSIKVSRADHDLGVFLITNIILDPIVGIGFSTRSCFKSSFFAKSSL